MKKFFALFMVIALLAMGGSALADDDDAGHISFMITASPSRVTFTSPTADAQKVTLSSNFTGRTVEFTASVSPTTGIQATVSEDILTLKPSSAGEYVVTVTGNNGKTTATTRVDVTVSSSSNPGSSGGGCSAGFSVLALSVLGGFIAARRK